MFSTLYVKQQKRFLKAPNSTKSYMMTSLPKMLFGFYWRNWDFVLFSLCSHVLVVFWLIVFWLCSSLYLTPSQAAAVKEFVWSSGSIVQHAQFNFLRESGVFCRIWGYFGGFGGILGLPLFQSSISMLGPNFVQVQIILKAGFGRSEH